jgi:hypothetical protein
MNGQWFARTRKRVRNRPNEEMVYKQTMRKLFEGQRHLDEHHEHEFQMQLGMDAAMDEDDDYDMEDGGVRVEPGVEVPVISITEAEVGQRSLHDFFGGQYLQTQEKERPRTALALAHVELGWTSNGNEGMEFEIAAATKPEHIEVERGQQTMDWFLFGRR